MFQGSRNVANGEHFSALMAEGGRLNATTWFDRTNYFETVPKGAFELALWMEADRHGYLLDAVTQESLDNQRDVVKEEKRQRYDNVPYGNALIDMYAAIFPKGHPYHHPTIGSMDDLDAASLEDVHAFFRRFYGPNNTVLTLVGDLTPQEGFAAAERYFGPLPASAEPPALAVDALEPLAEPVRDEHVEDVPADRLHLAFRLPGGRHPGVLRRLAGDGRPRWSGHLPALPAAGPPRADRQRRAGPRDGVRRRGVAGLHRHRRGRGRERGRGRGAHLRGAARGSPRRARPTSRWSPPWPRPSGRGSPPSPARRSAPTPSATGRCSRATRAGSTRSSTGWRR